jgi:hypothetical protein
MRFTIAALVILPLSFCRPSRFQPWVPADLSRPTPVETSLTRSNVIAVADLGTGTAIGAPYLYREHLPLQLIRVPLRLMRTLKGHVFGSDQQVLYYHFVGASGGGTIAKEVPSGIEICLMRRESGDLRTAVDVYAYTSTIQVPSWADPAASVTGDIGQQISSILFSTRSGKPATIPETQLRRALLTACSLVGSAETLVLAKSLLRHAGDSSRSSANVLMHEFFCNAEQSPEDNFCKDHAPGLRVQH